MNRSMISKELEAVGREFQAGNAFKNHTRGIVRGYTEMMRQLEQMENLLNYRLSGSGSVGADGERVLTEDEEAEAREFYGDIYTVRSKAESLWKEIRAFEKKAKDLDKFMKFST